MVDTVDVRTVFIVLHSPTLKRRVILFLVANIQTLSVAISFLILVDQNCSLYDLV